MAAPNPGQGDRLRDAQALGDDRDEDRRTEQGRQGSGGSRDSGHRLDHLVHSPRHPSGRAER